MASITSDRIANENTANNAVAAARAMKFEHQNPNTKSQYAGYQREWNVSLYLGCKPLFESVLLYILCFLGF
jgi:hypothetical protein